MTPESPAPPTPAHALKLLLDSPDLLRQVYQQGKRAYPPFPEGGAGLLLWNLLNLAGFGFPYGYGLPQLVAGLQARARVIAPSVPPIPTDIFVIVDATGVPVHVGFVAKVSPDGTWFLAVDTHLETEGERAFRARRVAAAGGEPGPVGFYLRVAPT